MEGSWITWILKLIFRKKVIIRCGYEGLKNTIFEYKLFKKRRLLLKILFLYIVELVSYKISDHIILSNLYDKKFVIGLFKIKSKKISLVSNFIDTEKFRPIPTEKKENTILYIGRLKEEKNLENLIKSFKYLKDYSLDIIGKGELKSDLLKKTETLNLQSQIQFLGMIPNSEIPEVINQYHILILPSLWEGNPKVILEAMSCGVTCIGTNIPGIKEIITHKKNGFLCKKDSKSIAYAIKYIFDNPKLRESLGKNAREYIIKNNSLEKIYKNEIKIFESLL
jgi:glycosyltransferase involved in cell wall biosynthesis